jgi:hypothetical protein
VTHVLTWRAGPGLLRCSLEPWKKDVDHLPVVKNCRIPSQFSFSIARNSGVACRYDALRTSLSSELLPDVLCVLTDDVVYRLVQSSWSSGLSAVPQLQGLKVDVMVAAVAM